ncbi:hypothetical protein IC575_001763 [Cucumis melo]
MSYVALGVTYDLPMVHFLPSRRFLQCISSNHDLDKHLHREIFFRCVFVYIPTILCV